MKHGLLVDIQFTDWAVQTRTLLSLQALYHLAPTVHPLTFHMDLKAMVYLFVKYIMKSVRVVYAIF